MENVVGTKALKMFAACLFGLFGFFERMLQMNFLRPW